MADPIPDYIPPPRSSGSGIAVAIVLILLLLPVGLFAIRLAYGKLRAPPLVAPPATRVVPSPVPVREAEREPATPE